MTSNYLDNDLRDPLSTPSAGQDSPSTPDVAKEQASQLGQQAGSAGQHVAAVAKDQTREVAGQAGQQAKDLLQQARGELTSQAGEQHQKLAAGIRSLGDELRSMAEQPEQKGVASDLARQAADRTHGIAEWLESREPGDLIEELKNFARQRPGAFLAAAAGLGLAAGRLTRGIKDDSSSESTPSRDYNAVGPYPTGPAAPLSSYDPAGTDYAATSGGAAQAGYPEPDFGLTGTPATPAFGEVPVRPYSTSQGPLASETFREGL